MTALKLLAAAGAIALTAISALAQTTPPPYGPPIGIENARKVMAAAEAEAVKNNWAVVISIVDSGANLVMLQKLDNAQHGSVSIATGKATTAVNLRRPTKALQDSIAQGGGNLRLLAVRDVTPLEGGIPIIVDGKIIGGIGVSGVTSEQDAQIAAAGAAAAAAK